MAIEKNHFDHILYEFEMYLHASLIRCNVQFVTNLLIDSRMVHLRNIAYFFCSEQDRKKKYLHYSMFTQGQIPLEINHELYTRIQDVASNSTCHLMKGRLKKTFKDETKRFEQEVFPIVVSKIKRFILELDNSIRSDYAPAWADKQIRLRSKEIIKTIHQYETAISPTEPV